MSPFKTASKLLQGKLDVVFCISMWIVTVPRAGELLQPNPAARRGTEQSPVMFLHISQPREVCSPLVALATSSPCLPSVAETDMLNHVVWGQC